MRIKIYKILNSYLFIFINLILNKCETNLTNIQMQIPTVTDFQVLKLNHETSKQPKKKKKRKQTNNNNQHSRSNLLKTHQTNNNATNQNATTTVKKRSALGALAALAVSLNLLLASRLVLSLVPMDNSRLLELLKPFYPLGEDAFDDPVAFIRARKFIAETHYVRTKDNYVLTLHRVVNPLVPAHQRHLLKPVILQHGLLTSSFNFLISSDRNRDRPRFDPRDLTRQHALDTDANYYSAGGPPHSLFSWQKMLVTLKDLTSAKLLGITDHSDKLASNGQTRISDALAFSLANEAFDVWMPNSRGSTYSLNHTHYDYKTDWQYWDFSFHEMALYDLPACVDYVLAARNRKSVSYVGHSQGNLMMFIAQSYNPKFWAAKIKPFVAMAPVAFIPNVYFGLPRALLNLISPLLTPTQVNELVKGQVLAKSAATERSLDIICLPKWSEPVCDLILTVMLGNNFLRANRTLTPTVAHHIPEGTSILNALHFGYMIKTKQFQAFDFGARENLRRYGSAQNPRYKIENIVSPDIAFVSGQSDTLATMSNVATTRSMLRVRLVDDFVVPDKWWGHADYMYAIGAGKLVNARMIALINKYRMVD